MSTGLKKYSQYKDSGVEWLGQIPAHWEFFKMKYCLTERNIKGFPEEEPLCATQSQGVIPQSIYGKRIVEAIKNLEQQKLVKKGDFVISLRSFQGGIEYSNHQGIISAAYIILCPNDNRFSKYYKYLFKSHSFIQLLKSFVTGIREGQNINYSELKNEFIIVPPLEEQQAIADFLDRKTQQIERVIAQKEKMIALLKERKQIIIQQAVTKGLNPDVPLKDSGVEWLGQIPAHWKFIKTKFLAKLNPNFSDKSLLSNVQVNFVPMECLRNGKIEKRISTYENVCNYTSFKNNDVLMAKVTPCFENGNIAIANDLENGFGFGTSEIFVFRVVDKSLLNIFLFYYFQNNRFKQYAISTMTGTAGLKRVSPTIIDNKIPLPPLEEQQAISDFLDNQSAKIDNAINLQQQQIERLRELKTSLIDSAVTGKIKVY
ncbi:restriction endonuclease subunit S [Ornithobacterium rhinotracheale]|uniref:restriction endonuclease subunit S n=1 Tax=Ornithobacterium rhinotracheale TaxID=28251 RepID=UPI00129D14C4|nr:restriction endonuclease subunit S [Ornithobacterium rhinotracheale]MRJ07909.1 restriction endonuclease subunit S [Ornithobacterium rhinotracheale]UOH78577.1 restriction endonuclease subunit S [Ornithobacterium rhinotracheale]